MAGLLWQLLDRNGVSTLVDQRGAHLRDCSASYKQHCFPRCFLLRGSNRQARLLFQRYRGGGWRCLSHQNRPWKVLQWLDELYQGGRDNVVQRTELGPQLYMFPSIVADRSYFPIHLLLGFFRSHRARRLSTLELALY